MDAHYDALVRFAHAAAERGLLASTCGNASVRVDDDTLLITASGASLATLTRADVVRVSLSGAPVAGPEPSRRPSMELGFHRRAYRERPRANAVLHCQSRAATILACAVDPPASLDFVPEVPAYVRRHAYADWAPPGTEALADAVGRALASDPAVTVVQLRNHGQVIIGGSWESAIRRGVFFELACGVATSGVPVRPIPEADARALRDLCGDV